MAEPTSNKAFPVSWDQFHRDARALAWRLWRNRTPANAGLAYLNPSIASSTALFSELNRDTSNFRRFITANAHLVTDVSQRASDLTGLIENLATTTGAIGRQSDALEVYRQTSELLRDELGLEPSPRLRELERSILNQDPTVEPPPRGVPAPRATGGMAGCCGWRSGACDSGRAPRAGPCRASPSPP